MSTSQVPLVLGNLAGALGMTKPATVLVAPELPPGPDLGELRRLQQASNKSAAKRVLSVLKKRAPRSEAKGTAEYSLSSERLLAPVKYVIKTGLKPFDDATGGVPFAKVTEIYGPEGCGKTALTLLICGNAQAGEIYELLPDGGERKVERFVVVVIFVDNENSLDDTEGRLVVYGRNVEFVNAECDTIDIIFKTAEDAIEQVEAIQASENEKAKKTPGYVPAVVLTVMAVDTIAATTTAEAIGQEWGKRDYSRLPGALREGFRTIIRKLKRANVAIICTNQVGDSFAPKLPGTANRSTTPRESDFNSYGGKGLKYYARLRIWICLVGPYKLAKGKFADGLQFEFLTRKCMLRPPLRTSRLVLLFKNALSQTPDEFDHFRQQLLDEGMPEEDLPIEPAGGYSPLFSVLEHLNKMGMLIYDAGKYRFNFAKYLVYDASQPGQVEEADLLTRAEWPTFYATHKVQVDLMYAASVKFMFTQNGSVPADVEALDADLVPGDDGVDEI